MSLDLNLPVLYFHGKKIRKSTNRWKCSKILPVQEWLTVDQVERLLEVDMIRVGILLAYVELDHLAWAQHPHGGPLQPKLVQNCIRYLLLG
jgi:hypothetical protein